MVADSLFESEQELKNNRPMAKRQHKENRDVMLVIFSGCKLQFLTEFSLYKI